jgi:hypothetical protein
VTICTTHGCFCFCIVITAVAYNRELNHYLWKKDSDRFLLNFCSEAKCT